MIAANESRGWQTSRFNASERTSPASAEASSASSAGLGGFSSLIGALLLGEPAGDGAPLFCANELCTNEPNEESDQQESPPQGVAAPVLAPENKPVLPFVLHIPQPAAQAPAEAAAAPDGTSPELAPAHTACTNEPNLETPEPLPQSPSAVKAQPGVAPEKHFAFETHLKSERTNPIQSEAAPAPKNSTNEPIRPPHQDAGPMPDQRNRESNSHDMQKFGETAAEPPPIKEVAQTHPVSPVASSPVPEPARPSAPDAAPVRPAAPEVLTRHEVLDAKPSPSAPLRSLDLSVGEADQPRVSLRVQDRTGNIEVVVRASDPVLTRELQSQVSGLKDNLEHQGLKVDQMITATSSSASASGHDLSDTGQRDTQQGDTPQPRQGYHQGNSGEQKQSPRERNMPFWMEEIERTLDGSTRERNLYEQHH